MLEIVRNNLIIDVQWERTTVNFDQVRVYKFRNYSESSQMFGGNYQLPRSRKTSSNSSCSSQGLPKDSFHPPKSLGQRITLNHCRYRSHVQMKIVARVVIVVLGLVRLVKPMKLE